ncbi:cytochrome b [Phenylobacterium deserti]|uniref:Cytochrome b n=1 Tax=Phenylobacterium deserti TaxID=1914756 RepID=A0A328AC90_9CAUL|nr:cytochrome b [Phenylobacterium deserti]RAK52423.1 cytochrome b [Phenylobacterium deserti]
MLKSLRRWAHSHTREGRYSPVGVAFHWTMAALILFQLWWGWRTGHLPVGADKLQAYEVHSQVGLLILVLTLARMFWRALVPGPINDADKPGWQSVAAHLTHFAFYACLLGLPLSGWAMWSATAREQDLSVAGVAPWPHLPFEELAPPLLWTIEAWAEQMHWLFVVALLLMLPLHIGAAIKHELVDRDDVLKGMLPGLERVERLVGRAPRRIRQELRPRCQSSAD